MRNTKQKLLIMMFISFLFVGAYTKTEAKEPHFDQQLIQMTKEVKKQNFKITNWSLYTRQIKNMPTDTTYKKEKLSLEKKYSQFSWQEERVNGQYKRFTGEHYLQKLGITETVSLMVYPQKNTLKAYLIYSVKGVGWSQNNWQTFSPTARKRLSQLFHNHEQIFSCITGETGDRMDIILSKKAQQVLNDFKAKKVEQVKEQTFISQSAYTNIWNQSLQTNGKKMNLQVALRHVGNKITLTIGTPIITTEY